MNIEHNNSVDTTKIQNVILIDQSIPDYKTFVDGVNSNTFHIVYNNNTKWNDLLNILNSKFINGINRLALAFIGAPEVIFIDNKSFFDVNNKEKIINLLNKFNIKNIDYLGCNTLNYDEWKIYYNEIELKTNVIVGASDDKTGKLKYGGDWEMETTNENIKEKYFNSEIENYSYLLDLGSQSLVLFDDGTVYSTGSNWDGELGLGTSGNGTNQSTLTAMINMPSGKTAIQIACGNYHSLVLFDDGTVYSTGYNYNGALGLGNETDQSTLTAMINMPSGKTAIQIACGGYHSLVLFDDGTVYGTGNNGNGELGLGTSGYGTNKTTLIEMILPLGKTATQIACGNNHSVVLFDDGTVYSTGFNMYGELGLGTSGYGTNKTTLTAMINMPSGKTAIQIACGYNHSVVLFDDGTVYSTGYNYNGALGLGTSGYGTNKTTLTAMINMPSGKTATQIACGNYHSVVLFDDGTVYSTGYNTYGQLGLGTSGNGTNQSTLTAMINMPSGKTATQIACGGYHSKVLFSDGTVYSTGSNYSGQLGLGTSGNGTDQQILTAMILPSGKTAIQITNLILTEELPSGTVCFTGETMIMTDQGEKMIKNINKNIHTIKNEKIKAVTKIISKENNLVCIEKDALEENVPSKKTRISKHHKIQEKNGKMYKALEYLNKNEKIYKVDYNGEVLYNILLEEHSKIMVNNMICETLHPENKIAKLYLELEKLDEKKQKELIKRYNSMK